LAGRRGEKERKATFFPSKKDKSSGKSDDLVLRPIHLMGEKKKGPSGSQSKRGQNFIS